MITIKTGMGHYLEVTEAGGLLHGDDAALHINPAKEGGDYNCVNLTNNLCEPKANKLVQQIDPLQLKQKRTILGSQMG